MHLPAPPRPAPVLAGYSGGLDSSVLLHLLAGDARIRAHGLRAIHVHHGLQPQADDWAEHCLRECEALGLPLQVVRVQVEAGSGLGPEGAAREARHRAFAAALGQGEILSLAHHRDDQAETFLLRALRGSGVDGLAAMRPWRAHGTGWLWRPLLGHGRDRLEAWARARGLRWIEDPGNADPACDRNFLRHRLLPLLRTRWPHASGNLARSAGLLCEASALLDEDDTRLLAALQRPDGSLPLAGLAALAPQRRARLLRRWVAGLGLPPLPARGIEAIEHEVTSAPADATPCFAWAGAWVRRWNDALHCGREQPALPPGWSRDWDGRAPLHLPTGEALQLLGAPGFGTSLRVHARRGGERIVLPGRAHSHALKHVLQDAGIPPWRRMRLPLLSNAAGELLAAGDAVHSARLAAWLAEHGAGLRLAALA